MHNWCVLPKKILIIYLALNFFDIDIDNLCGPPKKNSKNNLPSNSFLKAITSQHSLLTPRMQAHIKFWSSIAGYLHPYFCS
jgi:hypothetical protein